MIKVSRAGCPAPPVDVNPDPQLLELRFGWLYPREGVKISYIGYSEGEKSLCGFWNKPCLLWQYLIKKGRKKWEMNLVKEPNANYLEAYIRRAI